MQVLKSSHLSNIPYIQALLSYILIIRHLPDGKKCPSLSAILRLLCQKITERHRKSRLNKQTTEHDTSKLQGKVSRVD